jgi:hypothetical protein
VVERPLVVFEDGDGDFGAVTGTDGRLVGLLGKATGCIQPVDARAAALVGVDECLPAVDETDAVDTVQIADRVLCRSDVSVDGVRDPLAVEQPERIRL